MHEIHLHFLWLGNTRDLRQPKAIFDAGIAAVVDVAYEEPPAQLPRQLIYCHYPLLDGKGNEPAMLLHALRCIVGFLDFQVPTLVACSAGMSRSPSIAAFALAVHLRQSPHDVMLRISQSKAVEVKGPLWNELAGVFPQIRSSTSTD